jgi:hypothetical protein
MFCEGDLIGRQKNCANKTCFSVWVKFTKPPLFFFNLKKKREKCKKKWKKQKANQQNPKNTKAK